MTDKFTRRAFKTIAAAAIAATSFTTPVVAETTELIFNVFIPRPAPLYKHALEPWARSVEEASGGTLKINIPAASLAPPKKQFDIVQDGVADISVVTVFFKRKKLTLDLIGSLPLIGATAEGASVAAWETHQKFFADKGQWKEFVPLALFSLGQPAILSGDGPITSSADLQGFKVLATGKDKITTWRNLGASPVGSDGLKPFEVVSSGVADGVTIPLGTAVNQGLMPATKNVTVVPGGMGGRNVFALFISRDRFEALPEQAQKALTETAGVELARKIGKIMDRIDGSGRKKFEDKGIAVQEASPEFIDEINAASNFMFDDWMAAAEAAGVDGAAAIEYFKEVAGASAMSN